MKNGHIEIKTVLAVNNSEFIQLYKEAGWWHSDYDRDISFIPEIVKGSTVFAAAFDGSCMIGMGRAVSDNCSDAYIQDVVVLKEYRNRGIGGRIILHLIDELKGRGIDWIGLIGEPGTESFYSKLGFGVLRGYIPMKLK